MSLSPVIMELSSHQAELSHHQLSQLDSQE